MQGIANGYKHLKTDPDQAIASAGAVMSPDFQFSSTIFHPRNDDLPVQEFLTVLEAVIAMWRDELQRFPELEA